MKIQLTFAFLALLFAKTAAGQSADWQKVVWREPQVRYLLTDLTLGGNATLYRDYATRETDPDSLEAIRRWDAGSRVVNTNEFERRWLTNKYGKDGRVMRIVLRGTGRTITGNEVLLTSDRTLNQGIVRLTLAALSLGREVVDYEERRGVPDIAEALRIWRAGGRLLNTNDFELHSGGPNPEVVYRGTLQRADPFQMRLNTDLPYPETNVRYFMADMALGGSIEFYRATAEAAHEMGCLEAVRRVEDGYRIVNLDKFERKQVAGRTVITRQGSPERISGMQVMLSSDSP